jgi:hypothetical protein
LVRRLFDESGLPTGLVVVVVLVIVIENRWRIDYGADDEAEVEGGGWAYSGRLRTLVWPAPARVALSWSIATTRKSPSLSPTNRVLPLIIAEGRLGLKIIACNRSGAGLGGGGGVIAGALVASLSSTLASGSSAGV